MKSHAGTAASLMVFCVFAMSVLTVLMLGASAYRNVTVISRQGADERTALSYLWTKVKNSGGSVRTGGFHGSDALFLDEDYGGVTYSAVIYWHNGWLCELFFEEGLEFAPEDGEPVIQAEPLSFETLDGGLIKASCGAESVFISPRAGMGGASP